MFDFLFNPQGRISRKGWWLGYLLPYLAISIALSVLEGVSGIFAAVSLLVGAFYLWPGLVAVPVKRFHDLGMTGFWQLGFAAANLIVTIALVVGVGIYAASASLEDDLAELSTLPEDEQLAALFEVLGGSLGNPVVVVCLVLLAVLSLAYLYFMGIKRGVAGPNTHGEDPHASGRGFAD